jgi:hypothetical protein
MLEKLRGYIRTERLASGLAAARPITGLAMAVRPTPSSLSEIVIKYTYDGDANLDGLIDADDYFRIDSGFLAQPAVSSYAEGDFDYDGIINADDYFLIDSAFLGQSPPLAAMQPPSARATAVQTTVAESPASIVRRKARRIRAAPIF